MRGGGRSFVRCHAQIMLSACSTRRHHCQMWRFHSRWGKSSIWRAWSSVADLNRHSQLGRLVCLPLNTNAANFAGTQLAGCRCGWLLTYTAALSKDSRHHAASTSTGFASDFRRTRRHPNQPRNFSALRRYVGRIRFFIHSRSQPNNYYSACRFHTAHRQAPCSGLTLPRRRNAVAYIWQGRLGIEPTQAVLETASPALEHSPV